MKISKRIARKKLNLANMQTHANMFILKQRHKKRTNGITQHNQKTNKITDRRVDRPLPAGKTSP
jgi:hypothetical protein